MIEMISINDFIVGDKKTEKNYRNFFCNLFSVVKSSTIYLSSPCKGKIAYNPFPC